MEVIDITYEEDRTQDVYSRYFKFERARELKKLPLLLIAVVCSSMFVLGLVLNINLLWIIGLIGAAITALYLLIFLIRFQLAINKYMQELEKKAQTMDKEFQFSFDSNGIKYTSENFNSEIKWPMIKSYVFNDNDIYLFLANKALLDIISEEILGKEKFEKLKGVLKEQVRGSEKD